MLVCFLYLPNVRLCSGNRHARIDFCVPDSYNIKSSKLVPTLGECGNRIFGKPNDIMNLKKLN